MGLHNNSTKQIYAGSVISYFLIFLNIVLGLIYTPWILSEIGSSAYGIYTLAGSITAMFLLDFGMSAAITRFIAVYRVKDDYRSINEIFTIILKLYLIIVGLLAIIFIVIFFNINVIYSNLPVDELNSFKAAYIITALFVTICFPVNICNGVLNAYEEYIVLKLSDVLNKVGSVIVTIIALKLNGGLYALIFISGLFNLLTFIVKLIAVYKKTDVHFISNYFNWKRLKEIFSFSIWSTVSSVAQQMIFNVMPTILAMVSTTSVITMYGFANVIEGYISTITGAINGLFLPKISRIIGDDNDAHNVCDIMIRVGRINQSIILIIFIGFIYVGKDFVLLWLGKNYSELYICMLLLIAPYCISSSQEIAMNSLIALNKIRYTAVINILTGIFNILFAYVTAPVWGVIGVCFSICLTFFLRIIFNNIIFVRVLRINIPQFMIECHIKLVPSFIVIMIISYFFIQEISVIFSYEISWEIFLIKVFGIFLIFISVMWFLGWNKFEKDIIQKLIRVVYNLMKDSLN